MTRPQSAGRLLLVAFALAALYALVTVAGLRPMTAVISGSLPDASSDLVTAASLGTLYAVSHLLFVWVAPVLTIAAAVLSGWDALGRRGRGSEG